MTDERAIQARVAQVRAVFLDGAEADDLAQAEAMVTLGSGVVVHDEGRQGVQLLLVSPSGCTNYWHPGPEHGADYGVGAYATLVPGGPDASVGSLRDAARALVEHDLRVAARTGHVTCAGRTHPEDFDLDTQFCPCGHQPIVGHARP